jgi:c-di-GMP-binding flagellar brake protein YcgR
MAIPLNDQPTPKTPPPQRAQAVHGGREARAQYRVPKQTAGTTLEAQITTTDGRVVHGEVLDVAVGGAGIAIPQTKDLGVAEGASLRVVIRHFSRAKGVEVDAKLVTISQVGATIRYGLRFEKISEVVRQVDSFYARWFNRRRSARVMPDFSTKVVTTVRWDGGQIQARVHDISTGGIGILTSADQIAGLKDKARVDVTLALPDNTTPIACRAKVAGIRSFTKNVLIGLEFEPGGGIERYAAAVQRYVEDRQRSIAKYNETMSQTPKRAG